MVDRRLHALSHFLVHRLKVLLQGEIHSPFVYELQQKILKGNTSHLDDQIERNRRKLRRDRQLISVTDWKSLSASRKSISEIAKKSVSRPVFSAFLYRLGRHLHASQVLETGTSVGINTLYLAKNPYALSVQTLEANTELVAFAGNLFKEMGASKINILTGLLEDNFDAALKEKPDFIFLDAHHTYEASKSCVDSILTHCPRVKCIVIHDIYWSQGMTQFWKEIVSDEQINLTIDLFEGGLILPNVPMRKQHFHFRIR